MAVDPEKLGGRSSTGLVLEIDIGERLAAAIAHDETRRRFFRPTRAQGSGGGLA
jgi:hypothetical protein